MDNRFIIELRNRSWATNVRPQIMCDRWTIGDSCCDIAVPGCDHDTVIDIKAASYGIEIAIKGGFFKETEKRELYLPIMTVSHLHVYAKEGKELFSMTIHPDPDANLPLYDTLIQIPENKPITIGGNANDDIVVDHALICESSVVIQKHHKTWSVQTISRMPLGLYLNATVINGQAKAFNGDFLTCLGFQLQFLDEGLLFSDKNSILTTKLHQINISRTKGYPCLNRSPRRLLSKPVEPIQIQDPPNAPQDSKGNILISLLPIIAMIVLIVIMRGSSYSENNNMVLFSVLSMAVGGIGSVMTYIQTGKEYRKKAAKRSEEYERYISECDAKIDTLRKQEHDILHEIYIDSKAELQRINQFSSTLFDRRPGDEDFLDIRFGYGRIRSAQIVQYVKHEVFEQTDDLNRLPKELSNKYEFSEDLPVYVRGRQGNAFGIIGGKKELAEMLKILTLDIAVRQHNEDVQVFAFLSSFFQEELRAIRLFPHLNTLYSNRRSLAYDDESLTLLSEALFREISNRQSMGNNIQGVPWIVSIIDTELESVMRHPLTKAIPNAAKYHILFIFLSERKESLPQGCTTITYLMSNVNMGLLSHIDAGYPDQLFSYDQITVSELLGASEKMAPVFCGDSALSTHLTGKESLFDMLQIRSIKDLSILERWNRSDSAVSLVAPIGIRDNGEILYLDLHEKGQGPHGLIGGTTGSGKTQVLISYLLSLASLYSPDDLTFAVIDFKGGDIVKQLPELPHIVGSITNLEKNEMDRSLRSINAEKNRRMVLFDQNHANVSNISEYTKAYRAGKVKEPLPHLLIIVDEFAELKSQYPDFLSSLISVARVGRSLGIHLILCTQKPGGGVVDPQIWSNSSFRLCLRVQSHEDSNEVLHSPLAAEIHEPGRGYLQSDQGLFELFQSGYSGALEENGDSSRKHLSIYQLDLAGRFVELHREKSTNVANQRTQRDALLEGIVQAFQNSHKSLPRPLYHPPIPDTVAYESLKPERFGAVPIGWMDDPDNQTVFPLSIDLLGKNTLIVGKPQMGKTNLLLVILRWLAENNNPSDVAVYALDFNTYALKSMQELSIVGGVVTEREEERLKNLLKLLHREVFQRRSRFDSVRVQSFSAYRNLYDDLPIIIVMIDNYAAFQEIYGDQFGDDLLNLIRDGTSYGITFIATAQHISSLSYKLSYFFSQRIALKKKEKSDYGSVLDGCRLTLPDIRGRVLVSANKAFYEGQVFEAFSGKSESDKIEQMRSFVDAHRSSRVEQCAHPIPEVPNNLGLKFIKTNYPEAFTDNTLVYGMGYDNIEPVWLRMGENSSLSLLGGSEQLRLTVTRMFITNALIQLNHPELYILDDSMRPLRDLRGDPRITKYSCTTEELPAIVSSIMDELERRKETAMIDDDAIDQFAPIFVVINSADMLRYISDDSDLLDNYKHIVEDCFRLKAFFLLSDVPNKAVRYSSPDLIRMISDDRNSLILCELSEVKVFDIMGNVIRSQGRPLGLNEAFLLNGDDVSRVKLCASE